MERKRRSNAMQSYPEATQLHYSTLEDEGGREGGGEGGGKEAIPGARNERMLHPHHKQYVPKHIPASLDINFDIE